LCDALASSAVTLLAPQTLFCELDDHEKLQILLPAAGAAVCVLAACGGGGGAATAATSPGTPTLKSIAVTIPVSTIPIGSSQQLTATGTYSDGSTKPLTSTTAWSGPPRAAAPAWRRCLAAAR
jgi:hypothetical protein